MFWFYSLQQQTNKHNLQINKNLEVPNDKAWKYFIEIYFKFSKKMKSVFLNFLPIKWQLFDRFDESCKILL